MIKLPRGIEAAITVKGPARETLGLHVGLGELAFVGADAGAASDDFHHSGKFRFRQADEEIEIMRLPEQAIPIFTKSSVC